MKRGTEGLKNIEEREIVRKKEIEKNGKMAEVERKIRKSDRENGK